MEQQMPTGDQGTMHQFADVLRNAIGDNDPYPTPDEIAAHRLRGEQQRMPPGLMCPENFYAINFETFSQTLEESEVSFSIDMGGGVTLHYGTRYGAPIWLMDNPCGCLYAVWYDSVPY